MDQIMRELKRQIAGDLLGPEQLKGLIRAGYVYRNGDDHILTDKGRDALARAGVVTPTGEAWVQFRVVYGRGSLWNRG
jgi:hypothetical protein